MKMFFVFSTILFFSLISSSKAHTPGTVTADAFTFDKILQTFDVVLAKFDESHAFGDKQDQFKAFAESSTNTKNLLIVEIPITEDGENGQLVKQYGLKKEDYPVYKLFLKNKSTPIDYTGDKTEADLKSFVSQTTNLWFGLPGTLEAFDPLAQEFFEASSTNDRNAQKNILLKTRDQVKALTDPKERKSGESYLKLMEMSVRLGGEFLKREGGRIQNLLKGTITDEKKEELQHRANILLSFKSTNEPKMNPFRAAQNIVVNGAKQVVTGDKDL